MLSVTANSAADKSGHCGAARRCYPRKRTSFGTVVMSAKCQKRTFPIKLLEADQFGCPSAFDHKLVGLIEIWGPIYEAQWISLAN